ncbi:putative DNA double-strand break repair Rad50 ATPase [Variovorax sp. PBL-H6]|uniref:AAA family ATPase n=1 Tax=Variovorax sp. PBL-H6 TaxID=434009 RepID=UPI001316D2E9|nr:AAA family ATPase [Variovorax sp. PBL-H6]VTU33707.1 putative DNA double-strand break repair Rad50 ATPase [Variovorax sp. PBL-H6]
MTLSAELNALPAAMKAALGDAISNVDLSEMQLVENCPPLVLMQRGHALEAFAFGGEADYAPLYTAFKKHFMAQGASWATKDVSFIYCLPSGLVATQEFCSKVEVDVYFCRKFVVQLHQDIAGSLTRLPFLPLERIKGASIRPPSAQALLRSRNVSTDLASRLVVPGTGAQTLLQACLEEKYGQPSGLTTGSFDAVQAVPEEPRSQSILRSISIENFRAYRAPKKFVLGSAVTVLYGPNGFGKTSFFDAIDFVVTGGVHRFPKGAPAFAKVAKNLDCGDEPTTVSLTFERDGKMHTIVRDLAEPNKATLDGQPKERKDILALLTGGELSVSDRVDNLVALFRATHLFSQDRQALTEEIAESCQLPGDIVSRMLAFDDYVVGLNKSKEVLDLAKKQVDDAEARLQQALDKAAVDQAELGRLQGLQSAGGSSETLDARARALEQDIENAGFSLAEMGSARDMRSLRAFLEGKRIEAASSKPALEKCLESLTELRSAQEELKAQAAPLSDYVETLTRADTVFREQETQVQESESSLARLRATEDDDKATRDAAAWVVEARPQFAQLSQELADLKAKLEEAALVRQTHRSLQSDAATAVAAASNLLSQAEAQHRSAAERVARVQAVRDQLERGQLLPALTTEVQGTEERLTQVALELNERLSKERQAVADQNLVVDRVRRELASARQSASEIQEQVASLRSHVSDGNCLLCGHDHGTLEGLLDAIDRRLGQNEALLQISDQWTQESRKFDGLKESQRQIEEQLQQVEREKAQVAGVRVALLRERVAFDGALATVGLQFSDGFSLQLDGVLAQAKGTLEQASAQLEGARQAKKDAENTVQARVDAERSAGALVDALSEHLAASQQNLYALVSDPRRGAFDVATDLPQLERALSEAVRRQADATAAAQAASNAADARRAELAASHARLLAARVAHQSAARHLSALEGRVQALTASLATSGFSAEANADEILAAIAATVARQGSAEVLATRVAELEVALDAAATSAAFASINNRLLEHKRVADEKEATLARVAPWVKYFEGIHKLLGSQRAAATQHFTQEYGPRTAVIQRRLRPVYGFGDIEVASKGSSIAVQVKRNDESLRPTDYFSQSQVQTLVLGLFLTACSSQTWSGFSSVMMDDPVTHFDDLNTYALLDLISGLQNSPEGSKQFVISTCDEKLLQLARQKFRHLGDTAKFYSFSAIGANGPKVAEIP